MRTWTHRQNPRSIACPPSGVRIWQPSTAPEVRVMGSLKAELGDLDRVAAWLMVNGFVNAEPGYPHTTAVMNPLSDLIVDLYGPDVGAHARTAIGVATVPLNLPVVIAAEVEIS